MSAMGQKRISNFTRSPRWRLPANGLVRFTPESGHVQYTCLCLLWANSGHSGRSRLCGPFDTCVDFATERSEIDRLGEERLGSALQGLALCVGIAVGGDHDDRDVGSNRLSLGEHFKTG